MLQYVIVGLVLGGIYAISAAGLVVTYVSAGILNFSFGALAFFIARLYYYLNSQEHWSIFFSAVVAIVLAGPAIGALLYLALFRLLRLCSSLIKVVATVGIATTIPPLATLLFGNQPINTAPGLAPEPVRVFHFVGVAVTLNQVIVYACVLLIVIVGVVVLRYTDVGLQVRAMVDSPAMTSLSGTNPATVSIGVWAVSIFLAGLVGVLAAPTVGLTSTGFTLLMVSAFAAVVAAKLRSLPVAVGAGLLIGIAATLLQRYLPAQSSLTHDVLPSIPFAVMAIFLVYFMFRRGRVNEAEGVGGALDRAIAVHTEVVPASARGQGAGLRRVGYGPALVGFLLVATLPLLLQGVWAGLLASGIAYGVIFLSYSLVVGDGGMVWLCMVTFAGVGGLTVGLLSTTHHWPILLGMLVGGVISLLAGMVIGFMTVRLGDLYVALVTLTFALLVQNLVFNMNTFQNYGAGVTINPPSFASSPRALSYLGLAIFAVVGLFIVNLRRSTTGLALRAVRVSEPASKTIGVSVVQMKVLLAALASFVAGVGGALLAMTLGVALPANYSAVGGLIWLAVLVTQGIRSNTAALVGGLVFTLFPGITTAYLPAWVGQIPTLLFGFGAIFIAKNPDGALAVQARQVRALVERIGGRTVVAGDGGGDLPFEGAALTEVARK